ncbi:MAG: sigma-70 family RNA polymerase sigma factor [Alphaproteobacteria bacterium]|nr:sigma-70 family RNA polymerase sigma factor [Alphaproteobacteria bacterium]
MNSINLYAKEIENEKNSNDLVVSNLKLVMKIANEFKRKGTNVALEDLISAGNMGLIEASQKFDTSKNVKFITYARFHIENKIREEIYKFTNSFSVGRNMIERKAKIKKLKRKNANAGVKEISEEIKLKNRYIIQSIIDGYTQFSLDESCYEDKKKTYAEVIEDENNFIQALEKSELLEVLKQAVKTVLNKQEQFIIEQVFFGNKTLKEIGEEIHCTNERVRQMKEIALQKLKTAITNLM